ncbi:MAG: hypothetical protein ACE5I7_01945 [Candidatus Binatia bacterium]
MKRSHLPPTGTLLAVALLCLAAGGAAAQAVQPTPAPATGVLHYEVVEAKTRKPLYSVRGWNQAAAGDITHVVAASDLVFPGGNRVEIRVTFTREEPPRCVSWTTRVKDSDGTVVASGHQQFVPAAFPFLSRPVPPNAYPPLAPLGYLLTRLGLGTKQEASFDFILMGTSLLQMDLWVDGREEVRVPAGTFACHRVRMRVNPHSLFPNLPGFLQPFVRFFIPVHTLWLTADAPQTLIKYTGQMGPPGSPQLLIELVGVDHGAGRLAP